ncbi:MAG: class I SAM-dependent methyltransferase [Flavobacteriaceae bacterium]
MKKNEINVKDHLLSKEEFTVLFDHNQGIGQTQIPTNFDANAFYPKENYASHQDQKKGLIGVAYNMIQLLMFRYKFSIIKQYSQGNSILDIGGGTGAFASFFKKKGFNVTLTEPNNRARIQASHKGLLTFPTPTDLPPESAYSILTLWHVFEHLPAPQKALQNYHKLLKNKGLLLLALPNYASFDATYYQEYWAALDVPRHLWHYTPKGITSLVSEQGFRFQKSFPLWFDAFYIAYLSEQYRKSKFPLFRGFFIGLFSNLSALFTGQYSSLIYIFRKED